MKFDFYIFDLDGTLLNLGNIGTYADQILVKSLKKLKIPETPDKDERSKFWSSGDNYFKLLKTWGVSKAQNFWRKYDKVDFKQRIVLFNQEKIALFKDVKPVLERILNHKDSKKIGIVTNTANYIVNYILKKFKISKYFQEIFCMGFKNDQKFAKPSPSGILSILKKFQYDQNTHNAIMIGDSISDIIAAKKANISACLIKRDTNNYQKETKEWEIRPDYIIESLDKILKL
ncbi:MAG: HAD family hydrolase [Candidatus Thorarchaeota archaeon]